MEKRYANIIINKAGGNASQNAIKFKINLPTKWMQDMKINPQNKEIELEYNEEDKEIMIRKAVKNMYLVSEKEDYYVIDELCVQNEDEYYEGNHDRIGMQFSIDKDEIEAYSSLEEAIKIYNGNNVIGIIYE